jgi:hypothetical protein
MLGWFKKDSPPAKGPDLRSVDSQAKAVELARLGQLQKLLLLPEDFGGEDVAPNCVYVPAWVVEQKTEIDSTVIHKLATEGKISRYGATPAYQGKSFVPNAITIFASDPGSFTVTIRIWGDALDDE